MDIKKIDENRESGTWPPTEEEKLDMCRRETYEHRVAMAFMRVGFIIGLMLLGAAYFFHSPGLAIAGVVAVFVAICALGYLGSQGPV